MKNSNREAFKVYLHKCLHAAGRQQYQLAEEMHIGAKVLSRKLNGTNDGRLFDDEVTRIILILAEWRAINTREEALQLLELAQLKPDIFSDEQWKTSPLSQLEEETPQYNLSAPRTRFVGREVQVEHLRALLLRDDTHLVTLFGPGGSGKTRLAQHVAKELAGNFAQGVRFVALAAVRDSALVLQSIMQSLYIQPSPDSPPIQSLITNLRHKKLLLILDNFEQVADAATLVDELLAAAPGLKALVTSRAVLRISGEHEFEVPPLTMPPAGVVLNKENAARYGAVQLFIERARLVKPDFALTGENAPFIAQICARVDGLPLALELAAARIRLLTPQQLLEKLSGARLDVLKGGPRDAPDRHRTLLNTIKWSYDLLSPNLQFWFARLGVFNGGWSLDAVEAMTRVVALPNVQHEEESSLAETALDLLDQLLSNSLLVKLTTTNALARFTMLETLHEYALARLKTHGEIERLRDWHACYYLDLAEEAELGLRGAQQLTWLARLRAEQDNFRAALEWSLERADDGAGMKMSESGGEICADEVALRLASALRPFWEWQGYMDEGRGWLEAAVRLPCRARAGRATIAARASALSGLARLYCLQNDQSRCIAVVEESIALWRQLDDHAGLAMALYHRSWPAISQGDNELAKSLFEQGLQLLSADDAWLRAHILFLLGDLTGFAGDFDLMRSYHNQSKGIFERLGDRSAIADLLKDQGGIMILERNLTGAISNLVQSIEMSQKLDYKQFLGTGMGLLGFAVGIQEKPDPTTASVQALQLWGASSGLLGSIGSIPWLSNFPVVPEMIVKIRSHLDEKTLKEAYRRGRLLTVEQAMAAFRASQTAD
ncbi:MAG TPA: NB-ARC domain-containing protein [Ktedonobacteraceae bacterium]|nr:NB-ARC domain-containing protein [Ktedonobacteraceae bacterium]